MTQAWGADSSGRARPSPSPQLHLGLNTPPSGAPTCSLVPWLLLSSPVGLWARASFPLSGLPFLLFQPGRFLPPSSSTLPEHLFCSFGTITYGPICGVAVSRATLYVLQDRGLCTADFGTPGNGQGGLQKGCWSYASVHRSPPRVLGVLLCSMPQ